MPETDKSKISAARRAAAAARWAGHERQRWRTIRITDATCHALRAVAGRTWSERITRLLAERSSTPTRAGRRG